MLFLTIVLFRFTFGKTNETRVKSWSEAWMRMCTSCSVVYGFQMCEFMSSWNTSMNEGFPIRQRKPNFSRIFAGTVAYEGFFTHTKRNWGGVNIRWKIAVSSWVVAALKFTLENLWSGWAKVRSSKASSSSQILPTFLKGSLYLISLWLTEKK